MKLYYARGTCALAPMIVAAWAGLKLKTEAVNLRQREPEYLDKNPMGAVPALELDDGRVMTQVDAIISYLSDLSPQTGLGGKDLLESFEINQWNAFLGGDFHPAFKGIFGAGKLIESATDKDIERVKAAAYVQVDKVAGILDRQVGDDEHIVLGRRTTADAHAYAMVRWIKNLPDGLSRYPSLQRFMQAMAADPGVRDALKLEAV